MQRLPGVPLAAGRGSDVMAAACGGEETWAVEVVSAPQKRMSAGSEGAVALPFPKIPLDNLWFWALIGLLQGAEIVFVNAGLTPQWDSTDEAAVGGRGPLMSILPETLEIGRDVVEFVKPYFELFREDGFAPALSLGLLALAAAFAVLFLLRYVLPIRWMLCVRPVSFAASKTAKVLPINSIRSMRHCQSTDYCATHGKSSRKL